MSQRGIAAIALAWPDCPPAGPEALDLHAGHAKEVAELGRVDVVDLEEHYVRMARDRVLDTLWSTSTMMTARAQITIEVCDV